MAQSAHENKVATTGKLIEHINVSIGPQFLNLFSEQLYSSPNKAFEELVANSWDAGATSVHIRISEDLESNSACVWILDNGESMNVAGFAMLWSVASSPKTTVSPTNGRLQIGKFGIGKLATYVLANQLTYVCKANDGIIRAVTMDFRRIDEAATNKSQLHIDPLPLDVRELDREQLKELLAAIPTGDELLQQIDQDFQKNVATDDQIAEYGGDDPPTPTNRDTWTLALLTSLKPIGKKMQIGWIRRLLKTALPLGSSISIYFNKEHLTSSKIDTELLCEWQIGPDLGIDSVDIPDYTTGEGEKVESRTVKITYGTKPYPHAIIDGINDKITGSIKLYRDKISGGKSESLGHSNGYFINILGRVINSQDPYFGLEFLNHSAWSKFRASVRADGLNEIIAVNREGLQESSTLSIFRTFLRALFNKARTEHDRFINASWPKAGEILIKSWAAVPIDPLKRLIEDRALSVTGFPDFVMFPEDEERETVLSDWQKTAEEEPGNLIQNVEFETLSAGTEQLAKYDVLGRRILINRNHPIVLEYGETHELQGVLRNIALVDLLTDVYALDIGIDEEHLKEMREYRDQMYRTIAQINRKSGVQIANLLVTASRYDNYKALENITGDALEYIGFSVRRLGNPGYPEGIAIAPLAPEPSEDQRLKEDIEVGYSFTYDAKSTTKEKAKTSNLTLSGVQEHRKKHNANYSLVVAPEFQVTDKLLNECQNTGVTPIRAKSLARLVTMSAAFGPVNLKRLREFLELRHPDKVDSWIDTLYSELIQERKKPHLTLNLFIDGLKKIGFKSPNSIHIKVIAQEISKITDGIYNPSHIDVSRLVAGLQVIVPELIRLTTDGNVVLSTSPDMLLTAFKNQVSQIPEEYQAVFDTIISSN